MTVSWPCATTGFHLNHLLIAALDTDYCIDSAKTRIVAGSRACTFKHVDELLDYMEAEGSIGTTEIAMADPKPNNYCRPIEQDPGDNGSSSDTRDVGFSQDNSLHVSGKDKSSANVSSAHLDADHTSISLYPIDCQDMQLADDLAAATEALKNESSRQLAKAIAPGGNVFPTGIRIDTQFNKETRMEKFHAFPATYMDIEDENRNHESEDQEFSTSLRVWLSNSARVIDKIENLHIFKQIAEFVELAHSQGVVLRNVRPSSFLLSSLSRISIIESASSHTSSSSSADSTGRAAAPNFEDVEQSGSNKATQLVRSSASTHPMGFEMQREAGSAVPMDGLKGSTNGKSGSEHSTRQSLPSGKQVADYDEGGRSYTSSSSDCADNQLNVEKFPLKEILTMEIMWYKSPEELSGGTAEFASDMYSLGVLFVELFYSTGSQGEWSRAMSDLRHRLLPPLFLLDFPKEAAFCLLLLHPNPNCRPKAREILHADVFSEIEDKLAEREAIMHLEEKLAVTGTTLDFLLQMQQRKHVISLKLAQELHSLHEDIGEAKRWQALLMKDRSNEDFRKENSTSGAGGSKLPCDQFIYDEDVVFSSHGLDGLSGRRHGLLLTKSAQLLKSFTQWRDSYLLMINTEQQSGIGLTNEISRQSKSRSDHSQKMSVAKMGVGRFLNHVSASKAGQGSGGRLGCFFDDFCKFMKYSKFDVRAILQYGDILNTKNMVCSLNFDCDNEYFATAGVSRRIKIFDCNALLEEFNDVHYPVVEMNSRKKLSCLSWNKFRKNLLSSSDLEGVIQLWDVTTGQTTMDLKEHSKCAWSVDCSSFDCSRLASGSDDCCVKLWSTNQGTSVGTIKTKANICSVQFSPNHSEILAFGSADSQVYFHDLRYIRIPVCILTGHQKSVSFVRFADTASIVSASTDNTLKLWDLTKMSRGTRGYGAGIGSKVNCTLTYTGHTNFKNFVGLSVSEEGYIACGSETNEVFVYHKSLPVPMLSHKFRSADPISGEELEDIGDQFVSSVCWRNKSSVLVMANSVGNIQVLEMV